MPFLLDKMLSSITVKTSRAYPQDHVNEAIIWNVNPLVVAATSFKFTSVFLHTCNGQWLFKVTPLCSCMHKTMSPELVDSLKSIALAENLLYNYSIRLKFLWMDKIQNSGGEGMVLRLTVNSADGERSWEHHSHSLEQCGVYSKIMHEALGAT